MKVEEIRNLARERGLKPAKLTKRELVKLIQRAEGNFDCFASAVHGFCDQVACLWHKACMKESTVPVRAVTVKKSAPKKKAAPKKKSVAKKKVAVKKKSADKEKKAKKKAKK